MLLQDPLPKADEMAEESFAMYEAKQGKTLRLLDDLFLLRKQTQLVCRRANDKEAITIKAWLHSLDVFIFFPIIHPSTASIRSSVPIPSPSVR